MHANTPPPPPPPPKLNFLPPPMIGSFESTENGPYLESTEDHGSYAGTQSSSSNQIKPKEIVAWVLVVILSVLLRLIVSLGILMIQVIWAHRRSNRKDTSPDCTVAMESNPCYEASNVRQNKAQEAVLVYENWQL